MKCRFLFSTFINIVWKNIKKKKNKNNPTKTNVSPACLDALPASVSDVGVSALESTGGPVSHSILLALRQPVPGKCQESSALGDKAPALKA